MSINSTFKLNKIAFNNSCNSNFVSLSFKENTHISGKNGSGKSSKLNGVQLGFLPQTTFKNSNKHFYFKSSKGNFYSDEDCYDFYFPHNNSYIIYEFTNPTGTFCQILFKSKQELSIERAFIPLSMDEIYHWFWIFEENDELGFPTNIQLSKLIEKIKEVKNSKIVKSTKDAKEVLYTKDFNDDSSLYAIANVNDKKIDNVVDIFKLTSNASEIDNDMLKKTVVSLLNTSYHDNKKDVTNYDPIRIMNEYDRLEKEKRSINKKKNFSENFKSLKDLFEELKNNAFILENHFQEYSHFNEKILEENKKKVILASDEKDKAILDLEECEKAGKLLLGEKIAKEKVILKIEKNIAKFSIELEDYNNLFNKNNESGLHLHINDPEKAIELLEKTIECNNEELKKYKSIEKITEELKKDLKELENKERKLNNFNKTLKTEGELLFATGKIKNPEILSGVNKSFGNLKDNLDDKEIEILNNFTDLFSKKAENVFLCDINFGKTINFSFSKEDILNKISNLEEEIMYLEKNISLNNKIINEDDSEYRDSLKNETKKCKKEIKIIENGKLSNKYLIEEQEDLKNEKEEQSRIETDYLKYRNEYKKIKTNKNNKEIEHNSVIKIINRANKIKENLSHLEVKYGYKYVKKDNIIINIIAVNDSDISKLHSMFSNIKKIKEDIYKLLNLFVEEQIILDENNLLRTNGVTTNTLGKELFSKLNDIYESIEDNEDSLDKAFKQHANTTLEISSSLSDQINHFKGFERNLNKDIKNFELSSIEEVRINIELEPKVENFIEEVESSALLRDDASNILEGSLAEKIKLFIKDMELDKKKKMQINTETMIKSVSLEYKIEGKWTTKDGSTGTSTVASVMLLSLFIEKICGNYINLSIPVNLDETGNIDYVNMITLKEFLETKKLVLFSASPEPQISSGDIFKVLINFDDSIVYKADRLMNEKNRSTYHYKMGSIMEEEEIIEVSFKDNNIED